MAAQAPWGCQAASACQSGICVGILKLSSQSNCHLPTFVMPANHPRAWQMIRRNKHKGLRGCCQHPHAKVGSVLALVKLSSQPNCHLRAPATPANHPRAWQVAPRRKCQGLRGYPGALGLPGSTIITRAQRRSQLGSLANQNCLFGKENESGHNLAQVTLQNTPVFSVLLSHPKSENSMHNCPPKTAQKFGISVELHCTHG